MTQDQNITSDDEKNEGGVSLSWENALAVLKTQRILLVGGAGFIGHHLSVALASAGADVVVADNLAVNNIVDHLYSTEADPVRRLVIQRFLRHRIETARDAGVRFANVDSRDANALASVFADVAPTKIVHLAAVSSALRAKAMPSLAFDLQLNTLRNLLELVRLASNRPKQVLLLSSSTVYGDFAGSSVTESSELSPRGIYANTKYMAERLLRTYRDQYDVGCTIVRPSALYGEWCVSQRVTQMFIENALRGLPLILEGGGEGRLDFTYIDDLVQGILRALAFYTYRSDTFNLTYGRARPVRDLVPIVAEIVSNVVVEERPASLDRPVRGTLSTERAQQRLGYAPQFDLDTGYARFCQHYAQCWQEAQRLLS